MGCFRTGILNARDWTDREDHNLREGWLIYGSKWDLVRKHLTSTCPQARSRTLHECKQRWKNVVHKQQKKGPWTVVEDSALRRLVEDDGPRQWATLAQSMCGRSGKQCRERWVNHLDPKIQKKAWSVHEIQMLKDLHHIVGNKWSELAKKMPGRSENAIKNKWNSIDQNKSKSIILSPPADKKNPDTINKTCKKNIIESNQDAMKTKKRQHKDMSSPSNKGSCRKKFAVTCPSVSGISSLAECEKIDSNFIKMSSGYYSNKLPSKPSLTINTSLEYMDVDTYMINFIGSVETSIFGSSFSSDSEIFLSPMDVEEHNFKVEDDLMTLSPVAKLKISPSWKKDHSRHKIFDPNFDLCFEEYWDSSL